MYGVSYKELVLMYQIQFFDGKLRTKFCSLRKLKIIFVSSLLLYNYKFENKISLDCPGGRHNQFKESEDLKNYREISHAFTKPDLTSCTTNTIRASNCLP